MTRNWQTVLGVAVSLLLLYWALHDVALVDVWRQIRRADPWLLGLAAVIQTSTFLIRAARWNVFLKPALAASRYGARFAATCIGFMANNLLPARIGEFARAYALARTEPVTLSASFGSLVVERLFDGFTLAAFLAVPLFVPALTGRSQFGFDRLAGTVLLIVAVFGGALLALVLMIWRPDLVIRLFRSSLGRLLPRRAADKIADVIQSFIAGLGALRSPGLIAAGLAWSVVHWAWGAAAYFVGMAAFQIDRPGYLGALFLQSVNAFAVAIPSSPGFFGPFEASVRLALMPFAVEPIQAVSFAVGFHLAAFVPVTVIGLVYVWRLGLTWGEVEHSEELVEEGDGAERSPATEPTP